MKKLIYIFLFLSLGLSSFAGNTDKDKKEAKVIAGKITDNSGQTISGARITVAETGETFFADMDGNYKLTVKTDKPYSISVNTIGYQPLQLKSTELTSFSDLSLTEL